MASSRAPLLDKMPALLHAPLQSAVDVSFWTELARLKLEELKLSEEPLPIDGFLSPSSGVDVAGQLQLTADSFDSSQVRLLSPLLRNNEWAHFAYTEDFKKLWKRCCCAWCAGHCEHSGGV